MTISNPPGTQMAQHQITDESAQAMDETASWAVDNKPTPAHPRRRADDAEIKISINVLEQSLAHYFMAKRLNTAGQPLDASKRAAYDQDYGLFNRHPMDPRTETDEDAMTPDEALGEATDQMLSHAECVSDWLAAECGTPAGREPVNVLALTSEQITDGMPDRLLAVIMTGDNKQVLRAVHRLRMLATIDFKGDIDALAASMLESKVAS